MTSRSFIIFFSTRGNFISSICASFIPSSSICLSVFIILQRRTGILFPRSRPLIDAISRNFRAPREIDRNRSQKLRRPIGIVQGATELNSSVYSLVFHSIFTPWHAVAALHVLAATSDDSRSIRKAAALRKKNVESEKSPLMQLYACGHGLSSERSWIQKISHRGIAAN